MNDYFSYLSWIDAQQDQMVLLVERWANINSGTENLPGLASMLSQLKEALVVLGGDMQEISLQPRQIIDAKGQEVEQQLGQALHITKRANAPIKVLFSGHMDTVYPAKSPFQSTERLSDDLIRGPGVADLKGGLVVMLKALEAFERSPYAKNIGWEILINPDEEIGSPGAAPLLEQCAKRCHYGLVFEPSLPDGSFVSARKGSANFTVVFRGKPAHVGRDFRNGRNAIVPMAAFIREVSNLSDDAKGFIVNIGKVEGGGPVNIVPELAICRLNVRTNTREQMDSLSNSIDTIAKNLDGDGIAVRVYENITRPPKPFDDKSLALFGKIKECAEELGQKASWRETGGVCDGNILANAGLPTIDTVGVRGGNIHTPEEFIILSSLKERARLVALFLMKLAGETQ